jgi:hypothetical protein
MNYWIGQGFGILATLSDISIPQFKKKWQMLVANIAVNTFSALNLVFLNEIGSGIFLFSVAIVQAIVNLVHTLREKPPKKWEYALFCCLFVGLGFYGLFTSPGFVFAINGKNLLELLPIIGAVILTFSIFAPNEQTTRKFLLANISIWAVYTALIGSTTFFAEVAAFITTATALYKYRK